MKFVNAVLRLCDRAVHTTYVTFKGLEVLLWILELKRLVLNWIVVASGSLVDLASTRFAVSVALSLGLRAPSQGCFAAFHPQVGGDSPDLRLPVTCSVG